MASDSPFQPAYGTGVLSAPTSTASLINVAPNCPQVMFSNLGTVAVYFRSQDPTKAVAATSADCVILPGERTLITKNPDWPSFSIVCPGSTAGSIHAIGGSGVSSV